MSEGFDIVIIINARGLDTTCVGNVHRLPLIQALADGMRGKGKVLVVSAPVSLLTTPLQDPIRLWRYWAQPKQQSKGKNLFLFAPSIPLPISLAERWSPALKLCRHYLRRQFCMALDDLEFAQNTPRVLWATHPFHLHYLGLVDEKVVVYECYDDFVLHGQEKLNEHVRRAERELATRSDLILATARSLVERLSRFNPDTYYFPNAADFNLFSQARMPETSLAEAMKRIPKPIIGFAGNLFRLVDLSLLRMVIETRPDWSFVFVGAVAPEVADWVDVLKSLPNTWFLDWQDYYTLPTFFKGFDAAIMPYMMNTVIDSVNPNKLYQFMASGVPIASTPMPEVRRFEGLIEIGEGVEGFVEAIERTLAKRDTEAIGKLVSMAAKESWEERVKMVLELIMRKLETKKVRSR